VVTSLIVTWLDRDRVDADSTVLLLLAAVAGIPAFLLGAVALVLLSGRARSSKIVNTTAALAVLVSLLPMCLIFLREVWAAFAFALLFAILVSLVLTEPAEKELVKGSYGVQLSEVSQSPQETGASLPQLSSGNRADTSPSSVHRLPRYRKRRFSRGGRTARQAGDPVQIRRRREGRRSGVRYAQPANPSNRTSDAEDDSDALPQSQGSSNNLMERFGVLIDRLDLNLGLFERMLSDAAVVFQKKPPNDKDVQAPIEDIARASAEERLTALFERIETSADRLDRLIAERDSQRAELLAAPTKNMAAATSTEAKPAPDTLDALHSIREGIADLVRALNRRQAGTDDRESLLKRIQDLRLRLKRCIEE
jgi:hypothetical protein